METTRMSSKGQVVIPQGIRELMGTAEGTLFSVIGAEDIVILKKIEPQTREEFFRELDRFAKEQTRKLKAKGFKEEDLWKAVEKLRASHSKQK